MNKHAEIITKLQPHQRKALARALKNNLILAHSTGSGKTLTSIAIADALGRPATVLTPASLVDNYRKEIARHKKGGPAMEVLSLPTAVSRNIQIPKGNTLILDEAHALRNSGTRKQQYIKNQLRNAGRVFALTGTPAYNNIADWAPLVNIVSGKPVVPEEPSAFRSRYVEERKVHPGILAALFLGARPGIVERLKNKEELKRKLSPYVDVFDADVEKPDWKEETVRTEMDREQAELYKLVEGNLPAHLKYKLRNNLPPSKSEAKDLNAFLTGVRQVSNTPEGFSETASAPGPKIRMAADEIVKRYKENPGFRALVYSNFLDSGVNSMARLLSSARVPYAVFTGSLTPAEKKKIVQDYNSGKVPVILGSGSASEGLDLKGTRLIQLLEPHFNNSRLRQVIGRGIRYKSHDDLPPSERNVLVQRYVAELPKTRGWFGTKKNTAVDDYLTSRAKEKDMLMEQVKNLFKPQ